MRHLRAGKEIFVNAGFMASIIHRSVNSGNIILPDQIDPLLGAVLPPGEIIDRPSRTVFDAGIGFMVIYRNYNGGFSVNHIATPDITGNGGEGARLHRRLSVHAAASYDLPGEEMSVDPLVTLSLQGDVVSASGGVVLSYNALSVNAVAYFDSRQGISAVQSGLYIEKGLFGVGYNHYFSTGGGGVAVPLTLSSQLVVSISLYNVEKRELIRAIKYPKL
ncbi:MAG: type IX secretion system membrane protein PorP/SprF [Bacteroidales bacterium]